MHSNSYYIVAGVCGCNGDGPCPTIQSLQQPESNEQYLRDKQILEEFLKEEMEGSNAEAGND